MRFRTSMIAIVAAGVLAAASGATFAQEQNGGGSGLHGVGAGADPMAAPPAGGAGAEPMAGDTMAKPMMKKPMKKHMAKKHMKKKKMM